MNFVNLYMLIVLAVPTISNAESFYTGQVTRASDIEQYKFNKSANTFADACALKHNSTLNIVEFRKFYNRKHFDECLVRLSPSKSVYYTRWWLFDEPNK